MSETDKLSELRKRINNLDRNIFQLLDERFRLSAEIGLIKQELNKPIIDIEREEFLKSQLLEWSRERGISFEFLNSLWRQILHESRDIQSKVTFTNKPKD